MYPVAFARTACISSARQGRDARSEPGAGSGRIFMSLGLILIIILVIFLAGGFSGRLGGYGYGYGHRGMGCLGTILIIILILFLLHRI